MKCSFCEGTGKEPDIVCKDGEIVGMTKKECEFCDATGKMDIFLYLHHVWIDIQLFFKPVKRQFLRKKKTERGFDLIEFDDLYSTKCLIQESSLATEDAIWFGPDNADPKILASKTKEGGTGWVPYLIPEDVSLTTRMHLSREQVKKILPVMKKFVKKGKIV